MNHWLGKNVRRMRDEKHWTQSHLAGAAGIQLRTVQRVEKGDGASVETLAALAAAFDTTIDRLQMDWDAAAALHAAILEDNRKQEEELRKTHHVIEVTPVTASAHLAGFGDAFGGIYHCFSEDDRVLDAFARLQADMHDCIDIWGDVEATSQREFACAIFSLVEEMNDLGFVIATGTNPERWYGIDAKILYVVAMPKDAVKPWIAIAKPPVKAATG